MYEEVLNVSITFDHTKSNYKEEGEMRIFTFQNHCEKLSGVNFVSDTQFSYQRSLKLSFGEGSLGYPRPCKRAFEFPYLKRLATVFLPLECYA